MSSSKERKQGALSLVSSAEADLAAELALVSDDQVSCRGSKHLFDLDSWRIRQPLPESVYAQPSSTRPGCYELVSPCGGCGARLVITTGFGGDLTGKLERTIRYPRNWHSLPMDMPHGRAVFTTAKFTRAAGAFRTLIRSSSLVDSAVPAARFQGD